MNFIVKGQRHHSRPITYQKSKKGDLIFFKNIVYRLWEMLADDHAHI